jgi:predicted DNA-binding transcriptional regulator AlpA
MTNPSIQSVDKLASLPEKALLDEITLAATFQVSPRTIARWVERGELPAPATFGNKKIWIAGRIHAFIEQRISEAEAAANRTNAALIRAQTP